MSEVANAKEDNGNPQTEEKREDEEESVEEEQNETQSVASDDFMEESEESEEESEDESKSRKSKKGKRQNESFDDDFEPDKEKPKKGKFDDEFFLRETSRQAKVRENKENPAQNNKKVSDQSKKTEEKSKESSKSSKKTKKESKNDKEEQIVDEDSSEDEEESKSSKKSSKNSRKSQKKSEKSDESSEDEKSSKEEEESEEEEEEQVDLDDTEIETREEAKKIVRSSSDFAMVVHFLDIFRPLLHLDNRSKNRLQTFSKYSVENLEESLISCRSFKNCPSDAKNFLISLHLKLMQTFVVNKKPPLTAENWDKNFKNVIKREISLGNSPIEENPMEKKDSVSHVWGGKPTANYFTLPTAMKCLLLRMLCEWTLDRCESLKAWIESLEDIEIDGRIREKYGAKDGKGWLYWTLDVNDETPRFYREKPPKKGETAGEWETVSTTMEELNEFRDSLQDSTDDHDKNLLEFLDTEILPALVKQEKKKEESVRKLKKMESFGLSTRNIMYEGRLRRNVRKNPDFSEGNNEDFEEEEME